MNWLTDKVESYNVDIVVVEPSKQVELYSLRTRWFWAEAIVRLDTAEQANLTCLRHQAADSCSLYNCILDELNTTNKFPQSNLVVLICRSHTDMYCKPAYGTGTRLRRSWMGPGEGQSNEPGRKGESSKMFSNKYYLRLLLRYFFIRIRSKITYINNASIGASLIHW